MESLIKASIDAISRTISAQALGLAYHRPEAWADAARCFENVARKVTQDGGRMQFGWTFHHRYVESIPGPGYLFLTHHAVWHGSTGHFVDVTPYPNAKHHPMGPSGSIIFLVDDNAKPITTGKLIGPMPLRFFALNKDAALLDYVKELNKKEQSACQAIYTGLSTPHPIE